MVIILNNTEFSCVNFCICECCFYLTSRIIFFDVTLAWISTVWRKME